MAALAPIQPPVQAPPDVGGKTPAQPDANTDPSTWGKSNEQMPEKYRKLLIDLANQLRQGRSFSRRYQVKTACEARYYWRGLHFIWWSENERQFKIVGVDKMPEDAPELPRYDYVTNLFRSYGLAFIAVVSEGKINIRFWPQNANQQEDLDTAKAASALVDLVERDNDIDTLNIDECYHAFVDPIYAYRIRYETDGDEHGYDEVPVLGQQDAQLGSGVMKCPSCGTETDVAESPGPEGSPCPNCGAPMTEQDYVPPGQAQIPVPQGTNAYARGKVELSLVSLLELDVPMRAKEQKDISDLTWKREIHYSKLMDVYPFAAEAIRQGAVSGSASAAGSSSDSVRGGIGMDEDTERRIRLRALSVDESETQEEGLLTLLETWIRPWALNGLPAANDLDKQDRDLLKSVFPQGVRLCYFGDTYIQALNERLDDGWEIVNLMPGESLDTGAIGSDEVSVQRRHTTLDNIEMETHERGISPTFVDRGMIDSDRYAQSMALPGNVYEVQRPAGGRVQDGLYTPPPLVSSPQASQMRNDLFGPISQHVLGTYPAAYGGDLGSNDTARGISIQRNQAKGRLGIFYRNMKKHRSRAMGKAVECLRANSANDLMVTLLDPGSQEFMAKTVRLDQLAGNVFARPESDEGFPATWAEKQDQILKMLMDPIVGPVLASSTKNLEAVQRYTGLGELEIPGADSRQQQLREIGKLLDDGQAGVGPITTDQGPDPLSGHPLPPLQQSSVPIDPVMDNHPVHVKTCKEWAASDAGQEARIQNPPGYLNVRLHCMEHEQAMAPPPMPVAPGGPAPGGGGGAPPPGGGGDLGPLPPVGAPPGGGTPIMGGGGGSA